MIRMLQIHRFKTIRSGMIGDAKPFRRYTVLVGDGAAGAAMMELLYLSSMSRHPCSVIVPAVNPPVHEGTMITAETTDLLGLRPMERLRQRAGVVEGTFEHAHVTLDAARCLEISLDLPRDHPLRSIRLVGDRALSEQDIAHTRMFSLTDLDGIPGDLIPPGLLWTGYPVERRHYLWDRRWVNTHHPGHPLDTVAAWVEASDQPIHHVLWCDMRTATMTLSDPKEPKIAAQFQRVVETVQQMVRHNGSSVLPHDPEAQRIVNILAPLHVVAERADQGEPGLFLWEFPECGIHPTLMERMLREVAQIVTNRPIQVCIFTHSIEVLAHWGRMAHRQIISADDLIAYQVLMDQGNLISVPFHPIGILGWFYAGRDPRMYPIDTADPVVTHDVPWIESSD